MRRIVREAALADGAEGSRWLEIQVDPTSYAPFVGGITPALEIVLDEARAGPALPGAAAVAVIVAASRLRHPLEARTLARLAARYAGDGAGTVIGFGLSNDERRGATEEFGRAFEIARRAGLALVPHAGELLGPAAVEATLKHAATGPARARGALGGGPAGARPRRRGRRGPRGVPGQQRRARRLRRRGRGAAAPARRRRRDRGARRGRPAHLRHPAGRPVRHRPRASTGSTTPTLARLARCSSRRAGRPTRSAGRALADIDAWLAAAPDRDR